MAKIQSAVGSGVTEMVREYNTRIKVKGNRMNRPRVSVAAEWGLRKNVLRPMERIMAKINVSRIPTFISSG